MRSFNKRSGASVNTYNRHATPGYLFALVLLATTCGVGTSLPAFAQEAKEPAIIEEVTVTARKREESLQNVPISITAFTAAQIEEAGIERPQDFVALTPGVSMSNQVAISAGDTQIQIRGLLNSRDTEANFALVVDGVLQTNPNALNQELFDIQQIEVLKGPQGALYGRNAVAGAIIIDTKKPGNEVEYQGKAGYGNEGAYKLMASASGPLVQDKLLGRFGISYRSTDGEFGNIYTGRKDVDSFQDLSMRGRLIWNVTDATTVDFSAGYTDVNSAAINFNAIPANPGLAAAFNEPAFAEDVNRHTFVYSTNISPQNELQRRNLSVRLDSNLDWASLAVVGSYNYQKEFFLADGTSGGFGQYFAGNAAAPSCQATLSILQNDPNLLPEPFNNPVVISVGILAPYTPTTCDGYQYELIKQSDTGVELRLTSPQANRLRWIVGGYFANIDREVDNSYGADLGNGFVAAPYVPASGPNPTDQLFWDRYNTKVYSGFGDLTFDLARGLELSLSGRYDSEHRGVHSLVSNISAGVLGGPINPALAAGPIPDRNETFSEFQPKATVRWAPLDSTSIYTSYGRGFRSGGFNPQGTSSLVQQYYNAPVPGFPTVDAGLNISDAFKKEVVDAYELGFKSTLFERRLRIEAAAFRENVENGQFFEVLVGTFGLLRTVSNIDEAHVQGFEFGAKSDLIDWMTLDAAYALLDSTIDKNTNRPYTAGNRLPFVPTYTLNLGVQFNIPPFGANGATRLIPRIDFQRLGATWFHTVQDQQVPTTFGGPADFTTTRRDPLNLVDARLSLTNDRWQITLWSRNLFDKHYISEISAAPEFGGVFATPGKGRTFGVEGKVKF